MFNPKERVNTRLTAVFHRPLWLNSDQHHSCQIKNNQEKCLDLDQKMSEVKVQTLTAILYDMDSIDISGLTVDI